MRLAGVVSERMHGAVVTGKVVKFAMAATANRRRE